MSAASRIQLRRVVFQRQWHTLPKECRGRFRWLSWAKQGMVRSDESRFSSLVEVEASDVAAKHLTKEKLDLLRSSFLFQYWTIDQLIKLAYATKKKTYTEGTVIATSEGEHIEFLCIIQRGRVMVRSAVKGGSATSSNKSSTGTGSTNYEHKRPLDIARGSNNNIPSETPQNVDIAILGDGDVIGLVEAHRAKRCEEPLLQQKSPMSLCTSFSIHSWRIRKIPRISFTKWRISEDIGGR